jgi:2-polyprenyl-3-methyl-5-hydroxy-6-metoxy-1,4-benzoquinol methylase
LNLTLFPRNCPLCGCNDFSVFAESTIDERKLTSSTFASRKLPEYMHPRMVECNACRMLYANPALQQETLGEAYKEASFDGQLESLLAARTYRRLLESYRGPFLHGGSALDIGAGDGAFVEQLLAMGFDHAMGVEPSEAPIQAAKPMIREHLRQGLFEASEFAPDSLDLMSCFQVMEHVPSPLQMSKDAFSLLKPGGLFFVVVHNRRALSAKILGDKSPIFDIEHLQLFDEHTGEQLLQRAGFRSISVRSLSNTYPIDYWIKLFPLPAAMKSALRRSARISRLGNILISLPAGNLALIGEKPEL